MSLHTVTVSVANVWTHRHAPREIDFTMLEQPVDVRGWLQSLTYENRLELCTKHLVQTQVLFGEEVEVLTEKAGWAQVVVPSQPSIKDERGYPGWIPLSCLAKSRPRRVETTVVIQKPTAYLYAGKKKIKTVELSFLTKLAVLSENSEWFEVETPIGHGWLKKEDVKMSTNAKGSGVDIVQTGEAFLKLPYLWGGMSGFGYDCSGFTFNMLKANGYQVPRDAGDQAKEGEAIAFDRLKPGDLLCFAAKEGTGRVHHIGFYYGNGQMLHSPKTGRSIEIITLEGTEYQKELCTIRRYYLENGGDSAGKTNIVQCQSAKNTF
ncbi:C40 family peptidase [Bacillus sp. WMMC1349]|uniref:C40 family peptidase n=1 Tax=Bacillus sp. WMMC1349 TaxID=2736254 RepID=UPI002815818A|nr:C40 family peptidase [Bacillus sp. WMMC1349]